MFVVCVYLFFFFCVFGAWKKRDVFILCWWDAMVTICDTVDGVVSV